MFHISVESLSKSTKNILGGSSPTSDKISQDRLSPLKMDIVNAFVQFLCQHICCPASRLQASPFSFLPWSLQESLPSQHSPPVSVHPALLNQLLFQRLSWNHKIVLVSIFSETSFPDIYGLCYVQQLLLLRVGTLGMATLLHCVLPPASLSPCSESGPAWQSLCCSLFSESWDSQ